MRLLENLYLHNNFITKIEGLDQLPNLTLLKLSNNYIQGLNFCNKLEILDIERNKIRTSQSLLGILECPLIKPLNFASNGIDDQSVIKVLSKMMHLLVLHLDNNPLVRSHKNYHRTVVPECRCLTYLDECSTTEAWRSARQQIRAEKRRIEEESFRGVQRIQREDLLSKGVNICDYPELMSSSDDEKGRDKTCQADVNEEISEIECVD